MGSPAAPPGSPWCPVAPLRPTMLVPCQMATPGAGGVGCQAVMTHVAQDRWTLSGRRFNYAHSTGVRSWSGHSSRLWHRHTPLAWAFKKTPATAGRPEEFLSERAERAGTRSGTKGKRCLHYFLRLAVRCCPVVHVSQPWTSLVGINASGLPSVSKYFHSRALLTRAQEGRGCISRAASSGGASDAHCF